MDYHSLHMKTVLQLRQLAKMEGVKLAAGLSKDRIIQRILDEVSRRDAARQEQMKQAASEQNQAAGEEKVFAAPHQEDGAAVSSDPQDEQDKAPAAPDKEKTASSPAPDGEQEKASPAPQETETPAPQPKRRGRPPASGRSGAPKAPARTGRKSAAKADNETKEIKEKGQAKEKQAVPSGESQVPALPEKPAQDATEKTPEKEKTSFQKKKTEAAAEIAKEIAAPPAPAGEEGSLALPVEDKKPAAPAQTRSRKPVPALSQEGISEKPLPEKQAVPREKEAYPFLYGETRRPDMPRHFHNQYPGQLEGHLLQKREGYRENYREPSREGYREQNRDMPRENYRESVRENYRDGDGSRQVSLRPRPMQNRQGYYGGEYSSSDGGGSADYRDGEGVLEIQSEGYGFLRAENCQPGPRDVYVSIAQIRRFNLRNGDYIKGKTRPTREGDRYNGLIYINTINGLTPDQAMRRRRFEDLVPIYPQEHIRLESRDEQGKSDLALRVIDMLAPIGKGQRGLIVSQPKAGKTVLLKKIANAIADKYPDIHLMVLLIDERPEEVTDMQRSIRGEVVYSTFDEVPENHTHCAEMVIERAQRLVEHGKDVVILLDSITRLARAYNLVIPPSGRSLSGGLDPGALHKPKRFFGAARNIENGGSLTIIATALVETGSRMDDIIYEEFKGTGNMELHLDRKLSEKRIFPAIDMNKSGTRREDLLLSKEELEGAYQVRRLLSNATNQEMAEQMIGMMEKTATNQEFFQRLKGWITVYEKEGYTYSGR